MGMRLSDSYSASGWSALGHGGSGRVLSGPYAVELDYGSFRKVYHASEDLFRRKVGVLWLALSWWFLFEVVSSVMFGKSLSSLGLWDWLGAVIALVALWFILLPPLPFTNRAKEAQKFFNFHRMNGPTRREGERGMSGVNRRSASVGVSVRIAEVGVEEVAGDGWLLRLPYERMRRWPTLKRGMVVFMEYVPKRDSLLRNIPTMDEAGVGTVEHRPMWDGSGIAVPWRVLDHPFHVVWLVHRRVVSARRERRVRSLSSLCGVS